MPGNWLNQVLLGDTGETPGNLIGRILKIKPDSVLDQRFVKSIRRFRGQVILCGANKSVLAKVWMILSQMGVSDLYILDTEKEPDVPGSEPRSDTLTGPDK
jgi:hypothetical protein